MAAGAPPIGMKSFAWIGAVIALLVGSAALLGGPQRWDGRSLRSAAALADAVRLQPNVLWGATLLGAGVVITAGLLLPRPLLRLIGYGAAATWAGFFGLTFAVTAIRDGQAGVTGLVWLPLASFYIVLGRRARAIHING